MKEIISKFTSQINEALLIASEAQLKSTNTEIRNVVVCGLGGSGIGGRIVSQLVKAELALPFAIANDYHLPSFVNTHSLVIGSSYSGNTEETIAMLLEAERKGAEIAIITSGGWMKTKAEESGWNCIIVPGGEQPRAMLVYSLVQQLALLKHYKLIASKEIRDLESVISLIEQEEQSIRQEAREVAGKIHGKRLVIYSDSDFEGLAVRFRQQINENSKELCWHHALPEMTHNELVGWAGGDDSILPVYIGTSYDHPRTRHRWEICKSVISKYAPQIEEIEAKGKSKVAQLFYLIHLTDWVSLYLSELKKVDPVEVDVISYLKSEMAKK